MPVYPICNIEKIPKNFCSGTYGPLSKVKEIIKNAVTLRRTIKKGKITGRIIRTDLHPSTGGASYNPVKELGKHLKDIFLDPKQLKGRKDLYKKVYHESAHRWIYLKTLGSKTKVPRPIDEFMSALYGWWKGNVRYYLGRK